MVGYSSNCNNSIAITTMMADNKTRWPSFITYNNETYSYYVYTYENYNQGTYQFRVKATLNVSNGVYDDSFVWSLKVTGIPPNIYPPEFLGNLTGFLRLYAQNSMTI